MDAPREEYYSKPVTEIWIAFDSSGPGAKSRIDRERRAWDSCVALESLGYDRVVLVIRPGGASELAR